CGVAALHETRPALARLISLAETEHLATAGIFDRIEIGGPHGVGCRREPAALLCVAVACHRQHEGYPGRDCPAHRRLPAKRTRPVTGLLDVMSLCYSTASLCIAQGGSRRAGPYF